MQTAEVRVRSRGVCVHFHRVSGEQSRAKQRTGVDRASNQLVSGPGIPIGFGVGLVREEGKMTHVYP